MIVVADTTPVNYLILIGEINVLPKLYVRVVIPHAVREELTRSRAPGGWPNLNSSINAGCPIHFAFFAKWVGNQNPHSGSFASNTSWARAARQAANR